MKLTALKFATAFAVATTGFAATAQAEDLIGASFLPGPHHLHTRLLGQFANDLAEQSGGDLTMTLFPAGQLGAGPVQQYKRAVEAVADITIGVSAYTPTIFPRTMLAILPGSNETAVASTSAIWDAYEDHLAQEYEEVHLIGLFTVAGSSVAATRDLTQPGAMEGVKMAPFAAMTQPIIEGMGAVPVQLPITEVYTGLSTGTVDAASVSISNLTPPWNFWDVTTHMHDNMPVPFAVLFVVMNKERYEGLSDEHRAIVDGLSGREFSMRGAASFDLADQESLDAMAANPDAWAKMTRVTVSEAARAEMDAATQAGLEVIFNDYEGRGIDNAAEIYNALNQ